MKKSRNIILAALCGTMLLPPFATHAAAEGNLKPPFDVEMVRTQAGKKDHKPFTCKTPPAPMRDLHFYSMYSKTEGNSSVVDPEAYAAYKKANKPLSKFEIELQGMGNRYVRSNPPRPDVAGCSLDWLATWAKGGALLGDVNKNGEYTRKWMLASIANAWMQIEDEPSLEPQKKKDVLNWMHQVAQAAMDDFSRDEDLKSRQNNHLYWAAWGIASAAMATGDQEMFDWAMDRARFGINQIEKDGTLPLEVARGQRAYLYHLFSAMPLFMLANAGEKNGVNLFAVNNEGLRRLADVDLKNLDNPTYFEELTGKKQDMTHVATPSDLGWLEVYAQHYDDARAIAALEKYRPVKHSRMGGNITLLYAGKVVASPEKKDKPKNEAGSSNSERHAGAEDNAQESPR